MQDNMLYQRSSREVVMLREEGWNPLNPRGLSCSCVPHVLMRTRRLFSNPLREIHEEWCLIPF